MPAVAADTFSGRPIITFHLGRSATTPDCGLPCAEFIVADGEIAANSDFWLLLAYKLGGDRKLPLVVNSPGGKLAGALALGRMVRRLALPVIVAQAIRTDCGREGGQTCATNQFGVAAYELRAESAGCYSGCFKVFAGGVGRFLPHGAKLGVHQGKVDREVMEKMAKDWSNGLNVEQMEKMAVRLSRAWTADFLGEMGVDLRVLDVIDATPFESLHILTSREMEQFGLAPKQGESPPLTVR